MHKYLRRSVLAGKLDGSPEGARAKASEDLSRAVAVFPLGVKRLMARLNDQGVGARSPTYVS